jgi:hypothetical protein
LTRPNAFEAVAVDLDVSASSLSANEVAGFCEDSFGTRGCPVGLEGPELI